MLKKMTALCATLIFALALTGCPAKKGPLEKAGEKMDNVVDDLGDAVDELEN